MSFVMIFALIVFGLIAASRLYEGKFLNGQPKSWPTEQVEVHKE